MIEKEKALQVAKSLIEFEGSFLDTKYSASHHKVAIIFKDHVIELIGDDLKFIKYLEEKIPLSTSEYKQIYSVFCEELAKRRARTTEKFNNLERLLEAEKLKKVV
jgi:hypothetical protein